MTSLCVKSILTFALLNPTYNSESPFVDVLSVSVFFQASSDPGLALRAMKPGWKEVPRLESSGGKELEVLALGSVGNWREGSVHTPSRQ